MEYPAFFDALEALASAVIFSYRAMEAFANERLPESFSYVFREPGRNDEVLDRSGVERRIGLSEKFDSILPGICGVQSPKGQKLASLHRDKANAR